MMNFDVSAAVTDRSPHGRVRLGILGSGEGTNFEALAAAVERGELAAELALVISDVTDAGILTKAGARGVPARFIDPGPFKTKMSDEAQVELAARLMEAGVEYVICAGFMRRLKEPVLRAFPRRILNIHPSLLPSFPGRDAVALALAAGATETGCTVHLVNEEIDSGDILAQEKVPIMPGDTHATLLARVHAAEHRLYPRAIAEYVKALKPHPC
jgi:phosphoribosylglycinamide formyltransferase-1